MMMIMMKHQIFTPVWGRISESPGSRCTLEPLEGQRAAMTIIIPMTMTMTMTTTTTTAMMMMVMKDLGREMRVFGRSVTSAATSQITDLSVGMISRWWWCRFHGSGDCGHDGDTKYGGASEKVSDLLLFKVVFVDNFFWVSKYVLKCFKTPNGRNVPFKSYSASKTQEM